MKKAWKLLENILVITAFPLMYWVGYVLVADTVFLWQHGVEKQVIVKRLTRTSSSPRSFTTSYHYLLEMDGREFSRSFSWQLPEGATVAVLVSPEDSEHLMLASEDNNLYELFLITAGGKVRAVLIIVTYLIIISLTPWLIMRLIRNRGKVV